MRPPKRQKKNTETFGPSAGDKLWTVEELKCLLSALKSCPIDDFKAINAYLPERSLNEVKVTIERLRTTNPARLVGTHANSTAPIEMWLQKSEELQKYDLDHSRVLGQVFSAIATLEPHSGKKTSRDPRYKAIYRYLAALLNKESPPDLNKMDAIVLLDILDGLADHLKLMDTIDHQALMRQKYKLLRDRVNIYSPRQTLNVVKRRLKEDTLEACRQPPALGSRQNTPDSASGQASSASSGSRVKEHGEEGPGTSDVTRETSDSGAGETEAMPQLENGGTTLGCVVQESTAPESNTLKSNTLKSTAHESSTQETTEQESSTQEMTTQEISNNVCDLYCLNPFCIEQRYLEPQTNSSR